jgi:hypothetical protein
MLDDVNQDDDCGVPIRKGLSSMWLCAGAEKMAKVSGASQQSTGYTAGTKQELKSGAAGGDHRACMRFHCFSVGKMWTVKALVATSESSGKMYLITQSWHSGSAF